MVITGVRTKPPVRVFTLQLCNDVIDGGMMILKKVFTRQGNAHKYTTDHCDYSCGHRLSLEIRKIVFFCLGHTRHCKTP